MFGLSFSELLVIGVVALVAVGPQKLPGMLRTLGEWIRKLKKMTHDVRAQSGIDEILRSEGLHGGLSELRSLMRGAPPAYIPPPRLDPPPAPPPPPRYEDPYANLDIDPTREYPPEGADAYGALPDDLIDSDAAEAEAWEAPEHSDAPPMDPLASSGSTAPEPAEPAHSDVQPPSASS